MAWRKQEESGLTSGVWGFKESSYKSPASPPPSPPTNENPVSAAIEEGNILKQKTRFKSKLSKIHTFFLLVLVLVPVSVQLELGTQNEQIYYSFTCVTSFDLI